jgi:hypothetical protein
LNKQDKKLLRCNLYDELPALFKKETCLFVFRLTVYLCQCRIQLTISLSGSTNTQAQNIFPLYVLLARPTSNITLEGVSVALCGLEKWST